MAMILAAAMVVSMSACGGSKDAGSSGDSSSFTPITLIRRCATGSRKAQRAV